MKLRAPHFHPQSAFTMVEVAISIAIISFALLGIVGNLPMGMNVQRDNREATVVSQDATIFMEAISKGAAGDDDLTNYVYQVQVGNTNYNAPFAGGAEIIGLLTTPGLTNHAYVHSISGPAVEKPPQNNGTIVGDSFSYRIACENIPIPIQPADTSSYSTNLQANLHELRLTFLWPIRANGSVGGGRQTFRLTVGGQMVQTNNLWFFQPQSFNSAP